jgi:hypothetical protein
LSVIKQQLYDVIQDDAVRAKVELIVDLCVGAVADLDSLDERIYQRAQSALEKDEDGGPSAEDLNKLADAVLEGVRALSSYLTNRDFGGDEEAAEDELDFDFDLDDAPPEPAGELLDDDDIASAVDGLLPASPRSSDERWAALSAEMTSFSYALSTQLEEFDQRFADALEQQRFPQALRELDDVGNALIDGVFALMSTICKTYLETFDRNQMLPGHRDALGKALLVRHEVASMRRVVKAANERVQDTGVPNEERQAGIETVVKELAAFMESDGWVVMRPADRLELKNFLEGISSTPFRQAALCCEGLDKYLDSLLSVNQREVLISHDRELMRDIAATLEGVGPLVDITPHGAVEMVREAFFKAEALYGYQDRLDALLAEWKSSVTPATEPAAVVELGKHLAALVKSY